MKFEILYRVNINKTVNYGNKSTNLNNMIKSIKVDNKYLFNRIEQGRGKHENDILVLMKLKYRKLV